MDMELINKQNAISQELQQAIKNYKKTPVDRKTLQHLQTKRAKLHELWDLFNKTDGLIRKNTLIPENHEYYTSDLFTKVGDLFNATNSKIEEEIQLIKLAQFPSTEDTKYQDASGTAPIPRREESQAATLPAKVRQGITAIKELIRQAEEEQDVTQLSIMKLNSIEHHWQTVQKIHDQLWTVAGDNYDLTEYLRHEAIITEKIYKLKDQIGGTTSPIINDNSVVSQKVKLPTIELPRFDGTFSKWRQYKDLFTEMVHNQQLTDCQKLWYLKSSLTGEAAQLIHHMTTTSENYDAAWNIINNRYNNKRLIVSTTLQRLLSQQQIQRDSVAALKSLHDQSLECLLGLEALGLDINSWDPILVHILTQLLDRQTQLLWEQSLTNPRELPTFQEFMHFIELRFQSLEAVGPRNKVGPSSNSLMATVTSCVACHQSHALFQCQKFKNMNPKQRLQLVQSSKSCVNCLKQDHKTNQCPSTRNCQRCNKRHNTLVHLNTQHAKKEHANTSSAALQAPKPSSLDQSATSTASLCAASSYDNSAVLLSTAVFLVTNARNQQVECRAVLDSGSQVHLITQDFASKLGLQELKHHLHLQGVGATQQNTSKRMTLQIASKVTAFTNTLEALILPTIVVPQPRQYININRWNIPKNIKLADPSFNMPGNIDMLIGAGVFYSLLSVGQINLGKGLPILQNTLLGWLIGGQHSTKTIDDNEPICGICTEDEELLTTMEKFWEVEECHSPSRQMTTAELKCEQHFQNTHSRASDQRFVVRLPFQGESSSLGESYGIALQRFKGVERRLTKDHILRAEYTKFLQEYLRLGHMQEISQVQITGPHYFLPHHAVLKPDSTTTKLRVVFDASAKTSTNVALNDILAIGPSIQDDVFTQLLRFRVPRYVFTADIEKMYRQIWVNNEDTLFQLILWRESPNDAIKIYRLNTVTYGTSCAPFLAIRCLRQLAVEGANIYPLASQIINKNFYVDDVLAGSDNIHTAVDQVYQLRNLLSTAGFNLRKWCANDARLLNHMPEKDREINLEFNKDENVKTMGLTWTPRVDEFSIRAGINTSAKITKRTALADISKIFDPLGFMAPVTITAKIFLQDLWRLKLDWDAALPQEMVTSWTSFRNEFQMLNHIKVPRHCFGHESPKTMQIHIFADASERAYGAVAYMRSISTTNLIIVRLLCAKSKVAPAKQSTLPRLELCAAKLATNLMARIQSDLDINKECFHLWSDSTAVLGWISAQSSNYHTFIANRIAAIQRISTVKQWHYIESKQNPADMLSRGLKPHQLVENNFWFYGPTMLHGGTDVWTNEKLNVECSLELRQKARVTLPLTSSIKNVIDEIQHNNSFRRLQRIVAYMLRCSKPKIPGANLLGKENLVVRPAELKQALLCIIRHMQALDFQHHIDDLKKHGTVQHGSAIAHLSPLLDAQGVLRVGGRLHLADLNYNAKHPMLLSHKHPLTKLLLTEMHKENMHCGVQTLIAISRQNYWIVNGKTLARNVVHNCVQCVRHKPKLIEQVMGQLPRDRVTAARPFYIAGVDFFGPVYIHFKIRGKQPRKAYVAVFCCFTTKAVHLELVSDLSTDAFIGALRRFIGRRGRCQKLYCDNATNFKGTKNALAEVSEIIHNKDATTKILNECSKVNIEFCFIPPRAPHFGGLWEAAVKSAKNLLQSTLAAASLTYEEMETIVIDAEAILNSRPLTPMSSDPNDMTALTPGHFLIGEPLTTLADPQTPVQKISCLTRWNLVRHLKNDFWRRWSIEYLSGLQHRYKWNKERPDIKKGTMVVIKEDNLPPQKWSLGRIENVIYGEDGHVRVVDVKTANNIHRRPIHKLAPLPIETELLELPSTSSSTTSVPLEAEVLNPSSISTKTSTNTMAPKVKETSSTRKRKSGTNLATLFLTCLVLPIISASVTFTPFNGEPGVYFERIGTTNLITNSWNLVNYVDLSPFHQEAKLANSYHKTLRSICEKLKFKSACIGVIEQLQHKLMIINTNNQLLIHHNRQRRGALNIIGNIAGSVFGLLDSEYAEKLSTTIDSLKTNDETLKSYMENQTMFLDRTLSVMKKSEEEITGELDTLNKLIQHNEQDINQITKDIQHEKLLSKFNSLALQAFMQTTRFQAVQDDLIDILTDSHHGRVNPELLPPKEVQARLSTINAYNIKAMKLPFSISDFTQYYRIMTISHQVTRKYLIFNIKIPLVATKLYELLKLTAIPWLQNNTLHKLNLQAPYLMVDLLRESYSPMTVTELHECVVTNNAVYLCQQQPIYNANSTACLCEISLLRTSRTNSNCRSIIYGGQFYWKALHAVNSWLIASQTTESVNTVCNNSPHQIEISGSGILKVDDGCIAKTSAITIMGNKDITNTRQVVYVPASNTSQVQRSAEDDHYNSSRTSVHLMSNTNNISNLQEELHRLKITALNNIRPHDIHHYGLGYTLLFLFILCTGYIVVRYRRIKGTTRIVPPKPTPRRQTSPVATNNDGESGIITMFDS